MRGFGFGLVYFNRKDRKTCVLGLVQEHILVPLNDTVHLALSVCLRLLICKTEVGLALSGPLQLKILFLGKKEKEVPLGF